MCSARCCVVQLAGAAAAAKQNGSVRAVQQPDGNCIPTSKRVRSQLSGLAARRVPVPPAPGGGLARFQLSARALPSL